MQASSTVDARRLAVRAAEGAALGVALWCFAQAFDLLPAALADSAGVVLGALAGLALGISRFRRSLPILIGAAAGLTLVVTLSFLSEGIAARWARNDALPAAPLQAVVALSEGLNPDTTITGQAVDHILYASELVRARKANILVTTTTAVGFPMGFVQSEVDQRRLISMLANGDVWLRTGLTRTTRDEAVQAAKLLQPLGIRRIGVVTSPMHTHRACATFEAVGFDVTCIAARMRGADGIPLQQLPKDRMAVFGDWVYELAATVEYSARGWLKREPNAKNSP
jgi:uncharacterized SAM-binding protein YcdF (DUF218 family)